MNKVKDARIHSWPRVRQGDGKVVLSARVLTPARLYAMRECLFKPLYILWKVAVAGIILELVLGMMDADLSWIEAAGWEMGHVFWPVLGVLVFWHLEQLLKFPLCRLLFGRTIRIEVQGDKVKVGGRLLKKRFDRDQHLTFAMEPIHDAVDRYYQKSMFLFLVIGDSARYQCAEIFNTGKETRIVSNANMILTVGDELTTHDLDVDPTRRQPA